MSQIRVLVLRGGPSSEFEISLKTGFEVLSALKGEKYHAIDVVITKSGDWLYNGKKRDPHEILHMGDVVFNALHGEYGEDGKVQRLMSRFGVPYTGSSAYSSMLSMHKGITKDILNGTEGLKMPRHIIARTSALQNVDSFALSILNVFPNDKFVLKPIQGGSSVDTMVVNGSVELARSLAVLLKKYEQVLIEEHITGREATVGVIENFRGEKLYALPVVEIVTDTVDGLFSHEAKYNGKTKEICPANFDTKTKKLLEKLARIAHETLGLSHYSRADFIVAKDGIYFLEVNSLPGLTRESLIPVALQSVGSSYKVFIDHILTEALKSSSVHVR